MEPYFTLDDLPKIIADANVEGVGHIINCASDPAQFDQCLSSTEFPGIDVTIGLQPTLASKLIGADPILDLFENNPLAKKIKAIGEVGLDYHWVKGEGEREKQKILFIDTIRIANEQNLPLVIHSRKAESDCLDLLEKYARVEVLLHSFEGNLKLVNRARELGYLISIPTNVVIRKNRRKVALRAGLENIMIETDSPYCPPSEEIFPNTPKTIPLAAAKLAQLLEIDLGEVARVTSRNASNFYDLP